MINFFVTGNYYVSESLDLKFLPRLNADDSDNREKAIFADDNQDLQHSFSIAKEVFEKVERGTIKFVLIGIAPYVFSQDPKESPTICTVEEKILDDYIKLCTDNNAKPVCVVFPVKASVRKSYNADVLKTFRDTINKVVKKYKASFIDLLDVKLNDKRFKNNAHLNPDGAILVSTLLGARLYHEKVFSEENILDMDSEYLNVLQKSFAKDYKKLMHNLFSRMACNDFNRLSKTLPKETCYELMVQIFCGMTYHHLAILSWILAKDDYNEILARIFKISAEKISRKNKIKVGFYARSSSMWCGDDLYNLFARDERFEPTLFLATKSHNKVMTKEYSKDAEKFKTHGINVFDLNDSTLIVPELDLFFCLTPYNENNPKPFKLENLKLTTLLASFPYALSVADRPSKGNWAFYRVLYKYFASSLIDFEVFNKKSNVFSESRTIYCGYTKMDIFFKKNISLKFGWKMVRPDAKKIIWAPHHSIINNGPLLATFQWNYQFMYEFAKSHPETSWVFKSHTNLPEKAIKSKLFQNIDAYEEYLQKWDDLPNAQVYTGAYYQAIFATSDGMIQDSGSFIAEYQYADKPMIYLTRDTQKFNELGNEILKASYTVDGKDLDGIAAMMQRVFIEGDDYKAAERKEVFDKYLNYPKTNGMLASEFIYRTIINDLKEDPK